jgi:hypothetical protein
MSVELFDIFVVSPPRDRVVLGESTIVETTQNGFLNVSLEADEAKINAAQLETSGCRFYVVPVRYRLVSIDFEAAKHLAEQVLEKIFGCKVEASLHFETPMWWTFGVTTDGGQQRCSVDKNDGHLWSPADEERYFLIWAKDSAFLIPATDLVDEDFDIKMAAIDRLLALHRDDADTLLRVEAAKTSNAMVRRKIVDGLAEGQRRKNGQQTQ